MEWIDVRFYPWSLGASHARGWRMQFPDRPSRCVGCDWSTHIPARLSTGRIATIKARSKGSSTSSAFFSFDPFPAKEVVHDLGLASQDLTQLVAAIRNEGNPLSLERRGLRLDLILHLGVGK